MKPLGDKLFSFVSTRPPIVSHERETARDCGLPESWLRDAIFAFPDLVIGPCRAAGLAEDEWYPWQKEFSTAVGPIDVLLVSSQGRLAIVETKLASNQELRRKVLAQALDYLTHLPARFDASMPDIPKENGQPVAHEDDIRESLAVGDTLVIIASDEIDARVARLSEALLSRELTRRWNLALIELALFRPASSQAGTTHVIVAHLRNVVKAEVRQVIRVTVQDSSQARVDVDRADDAPSVSGRRKWEAQSFFENLRAAGAPAPVKDLAERIRHLAAQHPDDLALSWGTGREGSMTLKRNDAGIIELYGSGEVRFRPKKFGRALGEEGARKYAAGLDGIVRDLTSSPYPGLSPSTAAAKATEIFEVVRLAVDRAQAD